jgi:hypothetical protein
MPNGETESRIRFSAFGIRHSASTERHAFTRHVNPDKKNGRLAFASRPFR